MVDCDVNPRSFGGQPAVLRVLVGQSFEPLWLWLMADRSFTIGADPPQVGPVVAVVMNENRYGGVVFDVLDPGELFTGLGFVVDGGNQVTRHHHEHDRDGVGPSIGTDGGQDAKPSCGKSLVEHIVSVRGSLAA